MSFGLRELLAQVGVDIPSGPTVITAATVITAVTVGVVVTLVSAVAPAVRASRVAPIAALRDVAIDRSGALVDVMLSETRDMAAARAFFRSAKGECPICCVSEPLGH